MTTQTLLLIVISLLAINLIFVGVYLVLVLKEFRDTVRQVNSILRTVDKTTAAVSVPVIGAAGAVSSFAQGFKLIEFLQGLKKGKEKESHE